MAASGDDRVNPGSLVLSPPLFPSQSGEEPRLGGICLANGGADAAAGASDTPFEMSSKPTGCVLGSTAEL